jgi:hypothetical protein
MLRTSRELLHDDRDTGQICRRSAGTTGYRHRVGGRCSSRSRRMMMNAACRREQERTRHNEQHDPKDSASGKCLTFGEDSRQAEEDRGEGDSSRALSRIRRGKLLSAHLRRGRDRQRRRRAATRRHADTGNRERARRLGLDGGCTRVAHHAGEIDAAGVGSDRRHRKGVSCIHPGRGNRDRRRRRSQRDSRSRTHDRQSA